MLWPDVLKVEGEEIVQRNSVLSKVLSPSLQLNRTHMHRITEVWHV